jgi:predicted RNase H-like HicB family nuclease
VKTYELYAESGPMMKKTVVHVPSLLGCRARGDTTQEAIDNAPEAIRVFLRFMKRAGEGVEPNAEFKTKLAEHDKSGGFLGSAYLGSDPEPMHKRESDLLMKRLEAMHGELRRISAKLTPKQLSAKPTSGRPIGDILRHVCGEGGYLRGVSGASRIAGDVEKGRLSAVDALDQLHALEVERLRSMTDDERSAVVMRGQQPWTVRYAVRQMLEHAWEHYVEIAERLGVDP